MYNVQWKRTSLYGKQLPQEKEMEDAVQQTTLASYEVVIQNERLETWKQLINRVREKLNKGIDEKEKEGLSTQYT